MIGWQEFYEPRPTWFQWIKFKIICKAIGHRWSKGCNSATGSACKVCGYNSVQLN